MVAPSAFINVFLFVCSQSRNQLKGKRHPKKRLYKFLTKKKMQFENALVFALAASVAAQTTDATSSTTTTTLTTATIKSSTTTAQPTGTKSPGAALGNGPSSVLVAAAILFSLF